MIYNSILSMFLNSSKNFHQKPYVFNTRFVVATHTNTEYFTLNSVLIRENTGRRKIVFQHILSSVNRSFLFW